MNTRTTATTTPRTRRRQATPTTPPSNGQHAPNPTGLDRLSSAQRRAIEAARSIEKTGTNQPMVEALADALKVSRNNVYLLRRGIVSVDPALWPWPLTGIGKGGGRGRKKLPPAAVASIEAAFPAGALAPEIKPAPVPTPTSPVPLAAELDALRAVAEAVGGLDNATAQRVLGYVLAWYEEEHYAIRNTGVRDESWEPSAGRPDAASTTRDALGRPGA